MSDKTVIRIKKVNGVWPITESFPWILLVIAVSLYIVTMVINGNYPFLNSEQVSWVNIIMIFVALILTAMTLLKLFVLEGIISKGLKWFISFFFGQRGREWAKDKTVCSNLTYILALTPFVIVVLMTIFLGH